MHRTTIRKTTLAGCLSALAAVTMLTASATAQETQTFEVAEIGSRYVPVLLPGQEQPVRGTTFITEGYLYPEGTVTCTDGTCDGVVYDDAGVPAPEFPDAVVGMWTCYGTFTADGTATSGPLLVSTQSYDLGDDPGADAILTSGWELADVDVPVTRAIIGGTGDHASASGVQTQTLLGFNNTETMVGDAPVFGVVLSVELVTD